MILLPGIPGVAFGELLDGDGRSSADARRRIAESLDIDSEWAIVDQVHGNVVLKVDAPGNHGEADGLMTATDGLPLAIGTADCVPVAVISATSRGIAHAGWRGVANGVVRSTVSSLPDEPRTVVLGPHIRRCCYEVGQEVIEACGGFGSTTTEGRSSVDLARAIRSQVPAATEFIDLEICTMCDDRFASYRRDATPERQVSIVWI